MRVLTLTLTCVLFTALLSPKLSAQCSGQDALNCDCNADTWIAVAETICVVDGITPGGIDIDVTIYWCNQRPNPNLIVNPCTSCTLPVNLVTWIKQICIDPQDMIYFSTGQLTVTDLYNAILCYTNLCRNDYAAVGPFAQCVVGADRCATTPPFCQIVALPQCYYWDSNCIKHAPGGTSTCNNYCMYWRQYCEDDDGCWTCFKGVCTYPPTAPTCTADAIDCSNLTDVECCN